MVRLEGAIGDLSTELKPVNVLPEVLASLQRVEGLLERLVAAAEADAKPTTKLKQPPASRRAAPQGRAASA